jgi:hypothetical protein
MPSNELFDMPVHNTKLLAPSFLWQCTHLATSMLQMRDEILRLGTAIRQGFVRVQYMVSGTALSPLNCNKLTA